jgi:hypothetical protein
MNGNFAGFEQDELHNGFGMNDIFTKNVDEILRQKNLYEILNVEFGSDLSDFPYFISNLTEKKNTRFTNGECLVCKTIDKCIILDCFDTHIVCEDCYSLLDKCPYCRKYFKIEDEELKLNEYLTNFKNTIIDFLKCPNVKPVYDKTHNPTNPILFSKYICNNDFSNQQSYSSANLILNEYEKFDKYYFDKPLVVSVSPFRNPFNVQEGVELTIKDEYNLLKLIVETYEGDYAKLDAIRMIFNDKYIPNFDDTLEKVKERHIEINNNVKQSFDEQFIEISEKIEKVSAHDFFTQFTFPAKLIKNTINIPPEAKLIVDKLDDDTVLPSQNPELNTTHSNQCNLEIHLKNIINTRSTEDEKTTESNEKYRQNNEPIDSVIRTSEERDKQQNELDKHLDEMKNNMVQLTPTFEQLELFSLKLKQYSCHKRYRSNHN